MHLLLCIYFSNLFYVHTGSRRPSILPVPDMFTSSTLNIASEQQDGDESDDEMDDDVPWRSPSEKIA
jgi:potassium channel subfamily T protein 1